MTTPALPSSTHIVGDPAHTSDHNAIAAALNQAVYGSNNGSDFGDAGSTRANIHVPVLTPCACVATVNVPTLSGPGGATTIASGSNSAALPQATITVASTTEFPTYGTINVVSGSGTQAVTYTGTTSTTFTGCSGGTGTMSTGGAVTATFDGYLLAATDTILLTGQTTASQDGPWLIPAGVSGSWTRPTDFASGAAVKGRTVRVLKGAYFGNTEWTLVANTSGITVDTSSQTWTPTNQTRNDSRYGVIYGTSTTTSHANIFSPGSTTDCSSLIQAAIDGGATDILLDGNATSPVFYLNGPVFDDSTLNQNLGGGPQQRSVTIRGTSNAIMQLGPNLPFAAATVDGSGNLTAAAFTPDSASRWAFFPNTLRSAFTSGTNTVLVNSSTAVSGTSQSAPIGRLRIRDLVIDGGNISMLNPAGIAYANQCNIHWSDCTVRYLKYGFSWTGYSDRPQMRNINAQMKGQADSGNVTGPVLMYQTTAGDGVLIEGIECAGDWCVWNAFGCRGGIVRLPVSSGSYVFSHCDGITLEGGHAEMTQTAAAFPNMTIQNSRINIRNWWWSASVTSAHYGVTINDTASGLYINDASVVTLRDCVSVFLLNAGTDPVRTPDIRITSMMLGGSLTIDNFKYLMLDVGGIAEFSGGAPLISSANSGITTALTSAAVSSHTIAATAASRWVLRTSGASSTTWVVETIPGGGSNRFLAAVQTPTASTPIAYSAAGTLTNTQTYEYAVGTIADDGAISGVSSAVSAAASSSGTMRLPVTVLQTPTSLIVWRKTGTGVIASPDSFIILPVDSQNIQILDTGVNANGLPWQTSSIPATSSFIGTATPARIYDPISGAVAQIPTIAAVPPSSVAASRSGLIAMTQRPSDATSASGALTAGQLYVVRVVAEANVASATRNVKFEVASAGTGITLAKAAVFDLTGATQWGVSSDFSSDVLAGTTTARTEAVGSFALVSGVEYWIAFLTVGGGANIMRSASSNMINMNRTTSSLLWALGPASLTDMPATLTPSGFTAGTLGLWFGLY